MNPEWILDRVPDRRPEASQALRGDCDPAIWPPLSQKGLNPKIDVEDQDMTMMQLSKGIHASYMERFYTPDYHRNYIIIGTEGRIGNFGDHSVDLNWATVNVWNRRTGFSLLGHEVYPVPPTTGTHGGADPLMIEDFLHFVETGESQEAPPLAARMAVAVGCQGAESIRAGSITLDVSCP